MEDRTKINNSITYLLKEDGALVPLVGTSSLIQAIESTWLEFHLSPIQSIESASFSFAMVVRFALGLSAQDGLVCAIVRRNFAGSIALATLRHLCNSGAEAVILLVEVESDNFESKSSSALAEREVFDISLKSIHALGVPLEALNNKDQLPAVEDICNSCHTLLYGCSDLFAKSIDDNTSNSSFLTNSLVDILNELSTPIHSLIAPEGLLNRDTNVLYASSTLAIGAPLDILADNKGNILDSVGKLYLADISLPPSVYQKLSSDFTYLFSEQPVIKLLNYQNLEIKE